MYFTKNFNFFFPAYHHHFGRQCRVADYGFTKLIELFETIPTTIEITEDARTDAEQLGYKDGWKDALKKVKDALKGMKGDVPEEFLAEFDELGFDMEGTGHNSGWQDEVGRKTFEEMLHNNNTWMVFNIIHSNIYTIFLWHIFLFFFMHVFILDLYFYPLFLILVVFLFGDYERKIFKLSKHFVKSIWNVYNLSFTE